MFPLIAVLSTQPALTCAKSTIKAPQHCIKLVQSYDKKTPKRRLAVALVLSLITLNRFYTLFCI